MIKDHASVGSSQEGISSVLRLHVKQRWNKHGLVEGLRANSYGAHKYHETLCVAL